MAVYLNGLRVHHKRVAVQPPDALEMVAVKFYAPPLALTQLGVALDTQ